MPRDSKMEMMFPDSSQGYSMPYIHPRLSPPPESFLTLTVLPDCDRARRAFIAMVIEPVDAAQSEPVKGIDLPIFPSS